MAIWEALLLGVVQGLTEFLPISSTAHLLFVRTLLGHPRPEDAFTTVIQLGTLFAVVVYFRWDIARLANGLLIDLRQHHTTAVIREKASGKRWSVDGWTRNNGEVPDIFPMEEWAKKD